MKNAIALLFVLVLGACAPSAPPYFSISSDFSAAERETIRAAVDAWCESDAASCPDEVGWSERGRFELVDDLPEENMAACPEGRTCAVNANNDGDNIRIARNRAATGLDHLWHIAAHEWGHFCIDGHRPASELMTAVEADAPLLEIDEVAVGAWHAGCL